jgi:hypothetical protein
MVRMQRPKRTGTTPVHSRVDGVAKFCSFTTSLLPRLGNRGGSQHEEDASEYRTHVFPLAGNSVVAAQSNHGGPQVLDVSWSTFSSTNSFHSKGARRHNINDQKKKKFHSLRTLLITPPPCRRPPPPSPSPQDIPPAPVHFSPAPSPTVSVSPPPSSSSHPPFSPPPFFWPSSSSAP